MKSSIAQNVGVDISKDRLDVHIHPAGTSRRLTNDADGFADLICWLQGFEIERVVFEPTGAYHHGFERQLADAGLPLVKFNPRQARRFAQAIGRNAKTDAVDAAMLARLGASLAPVVRPTISQTLDQMKELRVARLALVKDRIAAKNRAQIHRAPLLKAQAAERMKQIDAQIIAIDKALSQLCDTDKDLKARFNILTSIPGFGGITAMAIMADMPELGSIENAAAASLAGLAPIARDSGQMRGRRFVSGGRAQLRQALYMPALVAIRFNATMKAKYQAFIKAGKPPKVAITAIMRKLLVLANALIRDGRVWKEITA